MNVTAQYVGFTAKATVREYNFLVRESSTESHEVTFTILNEAFTSRRLSFQNAPDICSRKLQRELADSANNPLKARYRINEIELEEYRESHASRKLPRVSIHDRRRQISSGISVPF
jgi:hypothetical protein